MYIMCWEIFWNFILCWKHHIKLYIMYELKQKKRATAAQHSSTTEILKRNRQIKVSSFFIKKKRKYSLVLFIYYYHMSWLFIIVRSVYICVFWWSANNWLIDKNLYFAVFMFALSQNIAFSLAFLMHFIFLYLCTYIYLSISISICYDYNL